MNPKATPDDAFKYYKRTPPDSLDDVTTKTMAIIVDRIVKGREKPNAIL